MNLNQAYRYTKEKLTKGKVSFKDKETSLIFRYILEIKKRRFFINPNRLLTNLEKGILDKTINKRLGGYPIQYIIGQWEFYGLLFYVGEGVLIPRNDTEILVDKALEKAKNFNNPKIIDLCSGTGCIGISLAKYIENSAVTMVEYSKEAIKYLDKNISLNNVNNAKVLHGDVTDKSFASSFLDKKYDIIISNPPYIPKNDLKNLEPEVRKEPIMALDGKEDGLYFYKKITRHFKEHINTNGYLMYEIGINQEKDVINILEAEGFTDIKIHEDLSQIPRVLVAKKT